MKSVVHFLFIASVGLNALFLTGCTNFSVGKWVHKKVDGNPCKYSSATAGQTVHTGGAEKEALMLIAGELGLHGDRDAETLKHDIMEAISDVRNPPKLFDGDAFEKMAKDLNSSEEDAMREYQRFIRSLQGKRLIVISPAD